MSSRLDKKDIKLVLKSYEKYATETNYPICKLNEYLDIKNRVICKYKPISSNNQINTIIKCSRTKKGMIVYHRLLALLAENIKVDDYTKFLQSFLYKNKSDMEIYYSIRKFSKIRQVDITNTMDNVLMDCRNNNILRSQEYASFIKQVLSQDKSFVLENYLDIGCADCKLTIELGNIMGLSVSKIYGINNPKWVRYSKKKFRKLPINVYEVDKNNKFPFKTGMFSLVSLFLVIHHVVDIYTLLKELNRIVKLGGYVIIQEDDAMVDTDYMLSDIKHMLSRIVKCRCDDAINTYFIKYTDWVEMNHIFNIHGFQYKLAYYFLESVDSGLDSTRPYCCVFQKVKNI